MSIHEHMAYGYVTSLVTRVFSFTNMAAAVEKTLEMSLICDCNDQHREKKSSSLPPLLVSNTWHHRVQLVQVSPTNNLQSYR